MARYVWVFATALALMTLTGCRHGTASDRAQGLILKPSPVEPAVINGRAFERASLNLTGFHTLVVPDDSEVRGTTASGSASIFLEKRLEFGGHPPSPMHIRDARHYMGVATRATDDTQYLGTFGEWDSHIEGGAEIRLRIEVPNGITVRKEKGLSGEASATMGTRAQEPDEAELKRCYWYGGSHAAPGWKPVPTEPDPDMTIK